MNFDIGEVLSRAWQITWKQRVLWIIGILMGFFVSIMFPLMFSPILFPVLMQNSKMDMRPLLGVGVMVGLIIAVLLFILVLYPVSVLAQTSITFMWTLVFIPLFAFITGFSTIFSKSAWVLTYLRFTRSPKLQPLPGTVEATL